MKDVRVPEQLQRAMAAEAEAAREARAKVIAAEGEHKASRALRHAAEVISEDPAALQVPFVQILTFSNFQACGGGHCRQSRGAPGIKEAQPIPTRHF